MANEKNNQTDDRWDAIWGNEPDEGTVEHATMVNELVEESRKAREEKLDAEKDIPMVYHNGDGDENNNHPGYRDAGWYPQEKHDVAKKNAPMTKVSNLIDDGGAMLDGTTVYVAEYVDSQLFEDVDPQTGEEILNLEDGHYTISSHDGYMPAFHTEKFFSLQELANAMREIADLRTWTSALAREEV